MKLLFQAFHLLHSPAVEVLWMIPVEVLLLESLHRTFATAAVARTPDVFSFNARIKAQVATGDMQGQRARGPAVGAWHFGQFNFSRISSTPSIFNLIPMFFSYHMSQPIAFLDLAPTTFALYFSPIRFLIVCILFFLMFFTIFPWQLLNFSCGLLPSLFFLWARPPLQVRSIISLEQFQHLMPSTVSTLLLPNFFYHNITTSMLSSC